MRFHKDNIDSININPSCPVIRRKNRLRYKNSVQNSPQNCLIPSAPRPLSSREHPLSAGAGLREVRQKRERTGARFFFIDYIKNLNISTELLLK